MRITWNKNWIRPNESPWSILEKVKLVNKINTRQLLNHFGTDKFKSKTITKIAKIDRDLFTLDGFNKELIRHELGIDLYDMNKQMIHNLTQMFSEDIGLKDLFRDNLTYCIECLKEGYHSLFHQYKLIHKCPFHLCNLIDNCSSCGRNIEFALPEHNIEDGFYCTYTWNSTRKKL